MVCPRDTPVPATGSIAIWEPRLVVDRLSRTYSCQLLGHWRVLEPNELDFLNSGTRRIDFLETQSRQWKRLKYLVSTRLLLNKRISRPHLKLLIVVWTNLFTLKQISCSYIRHKRNTIIHLTLHDPNLLVLLFVPRTSTLQISDLPRVLNRFIRTSTY